MLRQDLNLALRSRLILPRVRIHAPATQRRLSWPVGRMANKTWAVAAKYEPPARRESPSLDQIDSGYAKLPAD